MVAWLTEHYRSIAAIAGIIATLAGAVWKLAPGFFPWLSDFLGNWISTGTQNFYLKRQIRIMERYIARVEAILAANGIDLSETVSEHLPESDNSAIQQTHQAYAEPPPSHPRSSWYVSPEVTRAIIRGSLDFGSVVMIGCLIQYIYLRHKGEQAGFFDLIDPRRHYRNGDAR